MRKRTRLFSALLVLVGGLALSAMTGRAAENEATPVGTVRIGMVNTLFRDTPEALVTAMMAPFGALMESQTGLAGKLIVGGDAVQLGKLLVEDKVHLAVFHGVEFAWARQRNPELRPLMIAVNQNRHLHAVIVVRGDASPTKFADLKGQTLAQPKLAREHCHLFLERCCQDAGAPPAQFFSKITTPPNSEDALDDVVDKAVTSAVVDALALESFRQRKPARFARLKVLERSEVFPAAVVAYHPGVLPEATLRRFREGMLSANQGTRGRQFLMLWKLTAFEAVPADYEQTLVQILKAYPLPPK